MTALIGRDAELAALNQHLAHAISGKGTTVLISGEPGIGKTALVEEFKKHAEAEGVRILSGAAMSGSAHPFQVFSKALEGLTDRPLFEESEYTSFTEIFAVNGAGLLLAKASSEEGGLDADIFAGMLSAVQDFVRDSFGGGGKAGLGRLEYGDMKILIEHGQHLFLTAVFSGNEHSDMRNTVTRTLKSIEESHGQLIEKWSGKMSDIAPVQNEITKLAGARFLVRKDLEGVKLDNERVRIADRVLETLAHLSDEKPLVMFLEDVHWADESSLFVLNYLGRNIRDANILIIGTARPKEEWAFDGTMEGMRKEGTIKEVALEKLKPGDVTSIMNVIYPDNDFPGEFKDMLSERCGGNPLFVVEFLRHMRDSGSIAERDGRHVLVNENLTVPENIEELIHSRLERLSPEAIAIAEYASCIGRIFDTDAAMSVPTVRDPGSAMSELQAAGMVVRNNGSAEFFHAMYQDVLYSSISPRWQSAHHRNLGEYYEQRFGGREDDAIYELARHYARTSEHSKGLEYSIRAAERAAGSYAADRAITLYEQALGILGKIGEGNNSRKAEATERLGELQALSGRYAEAVRSFSRAMELYEDATSRSRTLRNSADALIKTGDFDGSLARISEAERSAPPDSIEHWRVAAMRSYALMKKGDFEGSATTAREAIDHLEKEGVLDQAMISAYTALGASLQKLGKPKDALDIFQRCHDVLQKGDDLNALATSYSNLGAIYYNLLDFNRSLEANEKSLELMKRTGNQWGLATVYYNTGLAKHVKGDLDSAMDLYNKCMAIAEKIGDVSSIALAANTIGFVHYDRGELRESLPYFDRAADINDRIGDPMNLAWVVNSMGLSYHGLGNLDRAEELYLKGYDMRREIGDRQGMALSTTNLGDLALEREDLEKAIEWYTLSEKLCREMEMGMELSDALVGKARTVMASGKLEEASRCLDEAAALAEEPGQKANVLNARIMLLSREGNTVAAESAYREIEALFGQISGTSKAISMFTFGSHLVKHGSGKNARHLMEAALAFFGKAEMALWAEKCRKALAELTPPQ